MDEKLYLRMNDHENRNNYSIFQEIVINIPVIYF